MRTLTIGLLVAFLALPLAFAPFAPVAIADDNAEVLELATTRIDTVISFLRDKEISKAERDKKIIETINPIFDFALMAKICLGKKHWGPLSGEERKTFVDTFVLRLQESYLEKLDLYTDEEVVVEKAITVKKRIHVMSHLVTKDDKLEMVYKFYKAKKGWKIYDVVILGVSVVQTYRSQFSGFLKEGSFAELMEKLRTTGGFTIPTDEDGKPLAE